MFPFQFQGRFNLAVSLLYNIVANTIIGSASPHHLNHSPAIRIVPG